MTNTDSSTSRRRFLGQFGIVSGLALSSSRAFHAIASRSSPMSGNAVLGNGGVHHVALVTRDFDKTLEFYGRGLGFTVMFGWGKAPDRTVFLDSGNGSGIELGERLDFVPQLFPPEHLPLKTQEDWARTIFRSPPFLHFALRTTRLRAALDNVQKFGARLITGPNEDLVDTNT
jgi:catechol 2,3-dioxygenase-like lactoylglutathione lyase family enzyme